MKFVIVLIIGLACGYYVGYEDGIAGKPSVVIEIENYMWIRRQRLVLLDTKKLAGHAQMNQQHVSRIEFKQNVLAASVNRLNARAAKFAFESSW